MNVFLWLLLKLKIERRNKRHLESFAEGQTHSNPLGRVNDAMAGHSLIQELR